LTAGLSTSPSADGRQTRETVERWRIRLLDD
jgi:hypothetical protein